MWFDGYETPLYIFVICVFAAISGAFAGGRIYKPANGLKMKDAFKDFAHVWSGILIGMVLMASLQFDQVQTSAAKLRFAIMLIALLTVEVACAILKKPNKE